MQVHSTSPTAKRGCFVPALRSHGARSEGSGLNRVVSLGIEALAWQGAKSAHAGHMQATSGPAGAPAVRIVRGGVVAGCIGGQGGDFI